MLLLWLHAVLLLPVRNLLTTSLNRNNGNVLILRALIRLKDLRLVRRQRRVLNGGIAIRLLLLWLTHVHGGTTGNSLQTQSLHALRRRLCLELSLLLEVCLRAVVRLLLLLLDLSIVKRRRTLMPNVNLLRRRRGVKVRTCSFETS